MVALRSPARCAAIGVFLVGLASLGCPPTSPTSTPPINLEVVQAGGAQPVWQQHINDISFYQNWDGSLVSPLPTIPLLDAQFQIWFQAAFDVSNLYSPQPYTLHIGSRAFGSTETITVDIPIDLHTIREAQVYIVDPQVVYAFDTTNGIASAGEPETDWAHFHATIRRRLSPRRRRSPVPIPEPRRQRRKRLPHYT